MSSPDTLKIEVSTAEGRIPMEVQHSDDELLLAQYTTAANIVMISDRLRALNDLQSEVQEMKQLNEALGAVVIQTNKTVIALTAGVGLATSALMVYNIVSTAAMRRQLTDVASMVDSLVFLQVKGVNLPGAESSHTRRIESLLQTLEKTAAAR